MGAEPAEPADRRRSGAGGQWTAGRESVSGRAGVADSTIRMSVAEPLDAEAVALGELGVGRWVGLDPEVGG